MDGNLLFLDLEGLNDNQLQHLKGLLHPSNLSPDIEFPWTSCYEEETISAKGAGSSLNVHAPVFEAYVSKISNHTVNVADLHYSNEVSFNNSASNQTVVNSPLLMNYGHNYAALNSRTVSQHADSKYSNGNIVQNTYNTYNQSMTYADIPKSINGEVEKSIVQPAAVNASAAAFKLNPAVSCFVPSNFQQTVPGIKSEPSETKPSIRSEPPETKSSIRSEPPETKPSIKSEPSETEPINKSEPLETKPTNKSEPSETKPTIKTDPSQAKPIIKSEPLEKVPIDSMKSPEPVASPLVVNEVKTKIEIIPPEKQNGTERKQLTPKTEPVNVIPKPRSWADIVSKGQKSDGKPPSVIRKVAENGEKTSKPTSKETETETLSLEEDKLALVLGKHLYQLTLNFQPVFLQPRGLINRRNWCYINATLQALLACPPFYKLLRNLPLGQELERGKSATPVIDSMVKVANEFSQYDTHQEELQPGQPFQPDFIYDMLKDLKSDCLKGQQEDAEEFLSFILNGMHEEMVKIIKYYEKKNNLDSEAGDVKGTGEVSDGEEEWQVITGSKHKGMVTRKVVEHKTPISELLGGQIKSFLTTSGSKTSASIQPFFTLQLDIQSDNVTSVSEALKEMTLKEPIQGYTCAKTKQEVEAYSHIALQKLPPVLILHLKRFVYNKTGGCKKVMKKTDYPIELELNKDLFSPDVKKNQKIRFYKLFAVMYHDGEEAIKGHYISDVYNHGSQTWVRCDDRTINVVSETQVLSHSPPRVPYLLFYQES